MAQMHEYEVPYTDGTVKTIKTSKHHSKYARLHDWIKEHPELSAGIGIGVSIALDEIKHIKTYHV